MGKRMRKKRRAACNGLHRGSRFALIRKDADFRKVQPSPFGGNGSSSVVCYPRFSMRVTVGSNDGSASLTREPSHSDMAKTIILVLVRANAMLAECEIGLRTRLWLCASLVR